MSQKLQGALWELSPEDKAQAYVTLKERFGVWPLTVWPYNPGQPLNVVLQHKIADDAAERPDVGEYNPKRYKRTAKGPSASHQASVFKPVIAAWVLNLYAPKAGLCIDPFSGGGTRAILSAAHGLDYLGFEVRAQQAEATMRRIAASGYAGKAQVVLQDATAPWADRLPSKASFCFTCPPYYNLEKYGGADGLASQGFELGGDLSMAPTYESYLAALELTVRECHKALEKNAFACWVVGNYHDRRTGELYPLNHDIAYLFRKVGFRFREEVILYRESNVHMWRVGTFTRGRGHLIRVHEYLLVFQRI